MKKTLLSVLKVLTIATFFMPLIVLPDMFIFPFIVPKVVFFRILAVLMIAAYVLLLIINKQEFRPRFSWLNIAVLFFSTGLFISTFFGVDWRNSFWDSHERMLGTFTILHYVLYYFILSHTIKPAEWKSLQWWLLSAGSLVMGVGLLQRMDPELLLNGSSWRVISTLGNAIYVGGYGLFLAFLGYLLGIKEIVPWKRWLAFFFSFLGVIGVFISGTRGTMLGLFASVGLMLLLYLIFLKQNLKARKIIGGVIIAGVFALVVLYVNRSSTFVESIPSLSRLLNTSFSSDTGSTRVMAWGIAWESFQDYPVFGWGPNNFYYAFNQYYRPEFLSFGLGETWFDNAHNVVMNTLATGGIFGIIGYVFLFIAAIYQIIYSYRQQKIDVHIMVVLSSFLIGHFIHNIFVFENPTSYLYFFFSLAYIEVLARFSREKNTNVQKDKILSPVWKYGVVAIALIFLFKTDINVAQANNTTLKAMRFVTQGQVGAALELYEKSKSFSSPHVADIRGDFVRLGSQLVQNSIAAQRVNDTLLQFFSILYEEQKINHAFRPIDIRIHILQIQMDILGSMLYPQGPYLEDAQVLLADAIRLSPKRQQLYFLSSSIYTQQGKSQEAIDAARQAVEYDIRVGDSWIHLALAYFQANQKEKIPELLAEAESRGVIFTDANKTTLKNSFGIIIP